MTRDGQDRERDGNLREVFDPGKVKDRKRENDMGKCRSCDGTGRIMLFTSEVDCDCVRAETGSSSASPPQESAFKRVIDTFISDKAKFVEMLNKVPDRRPGCMPPLGTSSPTEVREFFRKLAEPDSCVRDAVLFCRGTEQAMRFLLMAHDALREHTVGCRIQDVSVPMATSGLRLRNGARLSVKDILVTPYGLRPDAMVFCIAGGAPSESGRRIQSFLTIASPGGCEVLTTTPENLELALGDKVLAIRPASPSFYPSGSLPRPDEMPRFMEPIGRSDPLFRQFGGSFRMRLSDCMPDAGKESENE